MKKRKAIIFGAIGIFLCCTGIGLGIDSIPHGGAGSGSAEGKAVRKFSAESERLRPEKEEEIFSQQLFASEAKEVLLRALPERVILDKPLATLNGREGVVSYRWGDDCISVDENTLLLCCDCYFPEEKLQQKIFYTAAGPDYVPEEVFRQDSDKRTEDDRAKIPDSLEYRMSCPKAVEEGYLYELNGSLYCLSRDYQKSTLVCDLRELMGELYLFSPWVSLRNICDATVDGTRLLACTDEGLYEYDLESREKRLLEPAVFIPQEIVHVEGDCDCGETGFEFSGPIKAVYTPDESGYVFVTGTEYGDVTGITLKSAEGEILYHKELEEFRSDFRQIKEAEGDFLAVIYENRERMWIDRVDTESGRTETFEVPDEVFSDISVCAGFTDPDTLVYFYREERGAGEKNEEERGDFGIYRLSGKESQETEWERPAEKRITVFDLESSAVIAKY